MDLLSGEEGGGGGMQRSFPLLVKEDWRLGLNIDEMVCGSVVSWRRLAACLGFFHEDLLLRVVEDVGEEGS